MILDSFIFDSKDSGTQPLDVVPLPCLIPYGRAIDLQEVLLSVMKFSSPDLGTAPGGADAWPVNIVLLEIVVVLAQRECVILTVSKIDNCGDTAGNSLGISLP